MGFFSVANRRLACRACERRCIRRASSLSRLKLPADSRRPSPSPSEDAPISCVGEGGGGREEEGETEQPTGRAGQMMARKC